MKNYIDLKQRILQKLYSHLNEEQRKAVFRVEGPLLILAGAGSGKTTVVVNRIAYLLRFGNAYHASTPPVHIGEDDLQFLRDYLDDKVKDEDRLTRLLSSGAPRPYNVLAITFTNKAAGELKERLSRALGEEIAADVNAATFHSICARILRINIERLGYSKDFTIYDGDDQQRVVRDILKSLGWDDKMFPARSVLAAISSAKDRFDTPDDMKNDAGNNVQAIRYATIYAEYEQKLKSANAIDFDDIIILTVKLLQAHPDLLERYRNRFKYVSVDEYQDTNMSQYRLVELLCSEHKNVCVVGDDDQSIYRFRGATIENILNFEERYPTATVIRLEQNYRSTKVILQGANEVIKKNTGRKGKELWTEGADGAPILHYISNDERGEAAALAEMILSDVAEGGKHSDHAVLYRMNAMSNAVEQALSQRGIPYRVIGGTRFFDRKEVKDALAYLQLINNHNDLLRLMRIISQPKRGVAEGTMAVVTGLSASEGKTVIDIMLHADEYPQLSAKKKPLKDFAEFITDMTNSLRSVSLGELFEQTMSRSGYLDYLLLDPPTAATRTENIGELHSNIMRYEQETEDATLSGFLEEIALYTDLDNYDENADTAVLMTLHAAKGLEFKNVYIVAMEEGLFPSSRSTANLTDLEEERRLAYVGITRAKEKLHIFTAKRRMLFGQTQYFKQSRFLGEIPTELIKVESAQPISPPKANTPAPAARKPIGSTATLPKPKQETKFSVGERVSHRVFGEGTILAISPMGGDSLLEVAFEKVGTKRIMANYAPLKPIS